jgi:hypothetical protein
MPVQAAKLLPMNRYLKMEALPLYRTGYVIIQHILLIAAQVRCFLVMD